MSEEKQYDMPFAIYIFDESVGVNQLLEQCENLVPGSILLMPPGTRLIELRPGHTARVISFDGIIEEPGAEAKAEHATKWMLSEEGLKKA